MGLSRNGARNVARARGCRSRLGGSLALLRGEVRGNLRGLRGPASTGAASAGAATGSAEASVCAGAGGSAPHAASAAAARIASVTCASSAAVAAAGASGVAAAGGTAAGAWRGVGVGFLMSSSPISSSSVSLNSRLTSCSSRMVGWKARSVLPSCFAISAKPLGPNTRSATTPMTSASGAPTPNKDAEICRGFGGVSFFGDGG